MKKGVIIFCCILFYFNFIFETVIYAETEMHDQQKLEEVHELYDWSEDFLKILEKEEGFSYRLIAEYYEKHKFMNFITNTSAFIDRQLEALTRFNDYYLQPILDIDVFTSEGDDELKKADIIDKYLEFVKGYKNTQVYYSIENIGEKGTPVLLLVLPSDNDDFYETIDNNSIYSCKCDIYYFVNGEIVHLGTLMNLMGSLSLYAKGDNFYVETSSNGHSKYYTYVKDNAQYTYGYNTNNLSEDTVRYEEYGEYYDYAYGTTNYEDAIAEYSEIGKIVFKRNLSDDKNERTYEINDFVGSYTSENLSGLTLGINDTGSLDVKTYLVFGNDGIHTPGGEHNLDNTWIVSEYRVQNNTLTIIATDFGNECCLELTLLDENTLSVSNKGDSYSTDIIYYRDYVDDKISGLYYYAYSENDFGRSYTTQNSQYDVQKNKDGSINCIEYNNGKAQGSFTAYLQDNGRYGYVSNLLYDGYVSEYSIDNGILISYGAEEGRHYYCKDNDFSLFDKKIMQVVNCNEYVSLRDMPSFSAAVLTTIPLGEKVEFISDSGNGFYKVIYDHITGFVAAEYLSVIAEEIDNFENIREASKAALQRFIDKSETEPIYAVCDLDGDGIDEIIIRTVWHQTADQPYHYLILIATYNFDSDEYETSHHRKIEMELNDPELHYSKDWNRLIQADSYGNYNALYLQDDWLSSEKVTSDIYDTSPEMKYRSGRLYAKYLSFDIEQITQASNYDESLELLLDSVENGDETEYFPNKYSLCDLNNNEIDEVIIREYSPEYTEGGKFRYSIYEYDVTKKCFCLLAGQFISFAYDALAYDTITNSLVVNWSFANEPYFCFYGYENGKIVITMTSEEEYSFDALSFYNISDEQMEGNNVNDYKNNNAFYGIWCGASRDYKEAENVAHDLGEQGGIRVSIYYTPEWSNLNGEPWYALSAGSYSSEIEAYDNLKNVQMIVPDAYIRYSGEYLG